MLLVCGCKAVSKFPTSISARTQKKMQNRNSQPKTPPWPHVFFFSCPIGRSVLEVAAFHKRHSCHAPKEASPSAWCEVPLTTGFTLGQFSNSCFKADLGHSCHEPPAESQPSKEVDTNLSAVPRAVFEKVKTAAGLVALGYLLGKKFSGTVDPDFLDPDPQPPAQGGAQSMMFISHGCLAVDRSEEPSVDPAWPTSLKLSVAVLLVLLHSS